MEIRSWNGRIRRLWVPLGSELRNSKWLGKLGSDRLGQDPILKIFRVDFYAALESTNWWVKNGHMTDLMGEVQSGVKFYSKIFL